MRYSDCNIFPCYLSYILLNINVNFNIENSMKYVAVRISLEVYAELVVPWILMNILKTRKAVASQFFHSKPKTILKLSYHMFKYKENNNR